MPQKRSLLWILLVLVIAFAVLATRRDNVTSDENLTGKRWIWVSTNLNDGVTIVPAEGEKNFHLTFNEDGNVSIGTDCNSGFGQYSTTSANGLSFGPLASTLMFCEGSQETVFNSQLIQTVSYSFNDDLLYLMLVDNAGTMVFESENLTN